MNPVKNIVSMINPNPVFGYSSLDQANKGAGVSAGKAANTNEGIKLLQKNVIEPLVRFTKELQKK